MRHDEEVQRRREEMEAQAERATAQQRHLQDDVRAVRAEARERAEQADRLKIKYDYMIKSLGGGASGSNEEKKSEEGKDKASNSDFCKKYVQSGAMGVFLFVEAVSLVICIRLNVS